jgi:hypothetical protein
MNRANAHRTYAEVLAATGQAEAAARQLRRALRLYEAKAHAIAIAATRAQFAQLLAGAPAE